MTLEFKVFVREAKQLKNDKVVQAIKYQDELKRISIPVDHLKKGELEALEAAIQKRVKDFPDEKQTRDNRWTLGRIKAYRELHESTVDDKTIVKNVETLTVALKRFLEANAPHRWVFQESDDHIPLPYFVTGIEYSKRKRTRDDGVIPAQVRLEARGYSNGSVKSIRVSWSENDAWPRRWLVRT